MERSAFSRAWDYVGYYPAAKWGAMACAALSAVTYVTLIVILGLFTDLIASGGRIPGYRELSPAQRDEFERDWTRLDEVARRDALAALPLDTPADPASAGGELRWRAFVGQVLRQRAGAFAAQTYRVRAVANDNSPPGNDPDHVQLGLLSLVMRNRNNPLGRVAGGAAWVNAWTYHPAADGSPNRPYLVGLLALALLVALARVFSIAGMYRLAATATIGAITRLRRMIYHHSNRLGSLTVSDEGTEEAVAMFTQHVESVHDGLYAKLTGAVREPLKVALLTVVALAVNLWLGLAFLFAAGLVWLLSRQAADHFRRRGRLGARRAVVQLGLLQESITMMRLAKGYLMGAFSQARVERQLAEYSKAQLARFRGESIHRPVAYFIGSVAAAGLLFLAGWMILTGALNVAGLVTMAVALTSLYYPLDLWSAHRRVWKRADDAAAAIFAFLDRRGEVGQVVGAEFLKAMSKQLEFDQVTLRHPGTGRALLDGLSLTIPAGKRVAIVSPDEDAKHALVALIPRFLDPSGGEVRIDGKNIRWVTLDSLRDQVALVMQQNYVFNDTVANNIGCGDPSFSIPQIIEAAKLVHAHNFIQKLPYGYETPIGDRGFGLRLGEQFRIALARAVLHDPAVLVVEEPTESLDDGMKSMIDDAYERILPGRTVIFLPHRLSTVRSCDLVALIHDGKLEGLGEHRQLLQENELYRHLHYMEYNMFAGRV